MKLEKISRTSQGLWALLKRGQIEVLASNRQSAPHNSSPGIGAELRTQTAQKKFMTKTKVALPALVLALFTVSTAQAQVLIDVSKITCEQFILWKVTDPDKIALWLSGYYNGKRGNTIIDTKSLEENENRVKDYCRANNLKPTVMQAVEALMAANK
jgi:acid stress chaperone HdeB